MSTRPTTTPIWAFNALLIAAATAAAIRVSARPDSLLPPPYGAPWWALIPIAALAELCMFSVRYRADAQTFSFGEITLVLGLAFVRAPEFLIAQMLGLLITYAIRGSKPVRITFNLASTALTSSIAVMITRALAGSDRSARSSALWIAVLVSAAATAPIQSLLVALVRSIAERRWLLRDAPRMALFTELNAVAVAAMGVLMAIVFGAVPLLSAVAAVPLLLIYVFSRLLVKEYTLRSNVEFLYETAQAIHRTPDAERALENLLDRARTSFRAEYAAVLVRRPDSNTWLRFTIGSTAELNTGAAADLDRPPAWIPAGHEAVLIHRNRHSSPESKALLEQLGALNAMVAALRNESDLIGLFIVADRSDGVIGFSEQDRRLFSLLASQVAIGLENSQLERSLGALTRMEEELRHQATHDALTGLANRTLLSSVLERPDHDERALLLIDLDDFKTINDSLGHAAGDQVLVMVAERLRSAVREEDLVARLGGDEFAIVLGVSSTGRSARETADRVSEAISPPMRVAGRDVEVRCSIGIASAAHGVPIEELVRNADVAMYAAKHGGKGRHMVFESGMDDSARERLQIISGLRSAMSLEQLSVAYQPIVELVSSSVVAVEALLRWEHAELGQLGPDRFIPLAEESGLIIAIGRWTLHRACTEVAPALSPSGSPLELHVNVSPRQIADPEFASVVEQVTEATGLHPSRLVLEITEKTALATSEMLFTNVEKLRTLGVRLALDDFGTGYSSVAAAHGFPLDLIKIDQLFVRALDPSSDSSLVRAILAMAVSLGLMSVAEGIETPEQKNVLMQLGCPYGQGYLFAHPAPIGELMAQWQALAGV